MRRHPWQVGTFLLFLLAGSVGFLATAGADSRVAELVARDDATGLRALGPTAMAEMVRLYEAGDTAERTRIANLFYQLSWKSPAAVAVLMRDVHTQDPGPASPSSTRSAGSATIRRSWRPSSRT